MTPAEAFRKYWETLDEKTVSEIGKYYTDDAFFQDPFNAVTGIGKIRHIFEHMFEVLLEPRFKILDAVVQGDEAFFTWDFTFKMKSYKPHLDQTIHGSSFVRFAPDGRVRYHRDYWDAAGELYARLPVIGALMRWLARKMA
jgi:steroid delta-isomerase